MKRHFSVLVCAASVTMAASISTARAEEDDPYEVEAAPQTVVVSAAGGGTAERSDLYATGQSPKTVTVIDPPQGEQTIGYVKRELNGELIFAGAFLTIAVYGFSVIPAATSPVVADQRLYIPVVGPWLDLGERPHCGRTEGRPSCPNEVNDKALLITSGSLQGLGTLFMLGGLLFPKRELVVTQARSVHVAPVANAGGVGVTAFGTLPL